MTLTEKYDPLKGKMLQILDKDGKIVAKNLEPAIDDASLLKAYKAMVLTRVADEKSVKLQRQGRLGAYPPSKGQEASQVGPAMAMGKEDWLVWSFREMGALLYRDIPLWRITLYWMGNEEGNNWQGTRVAPSAVPVGSQLPHAVGISYAAQIRGEKSVCFVYFGDGSTSEGDFHGALNFAGVFKTPTVFVCQNNQYAISLPRSRQCAARTLAQKAVGYGIPGIQVDGNDVLALYAAASEAAERARKGEGPTLIESYTYRMGDHTTSDDATRYRMDAEKAEWAKKDPISRFEVYLTKKGLWNEELEKKEREDANALVDAAVKQAEEFPMPSLEDTFRFTYAEMTPELNEQLEGLRREIAGKGGE
jgi:pyruvate dehydrogenase E1 component alpha subunit